MRNLDEKFKIRFKELIFLLFSRILDKLKDLYI